MRITVLTVGSRGDVQPCVALSAGLKAAGHEVRLATHAPFRELIEAHGLEFRPLAGDPRELIRGREGRAWLESGENMLLFVRRFLRLYRPLLRTHLADVQSACVGSDVIIFSPLAFAGWHVAEAMGVPSWMAALQPATRTSAFPALPMPGQDTPGRSFNLLTHAVYEQLGWQALRSAINQWRRESLQLGPIPFAGPMRVMRERQTPVLYGFSSLVVPKPADWPAWYDVTGYWTLDSPASWRPPPKVVEFLERGAPPVYVGFGSMLPRDPAETTIVVLGALRRAGVRGILATGWAGKAFEKFPPDVLVLDEIPHDWLFPRVAAVVHHGGAGTTAAAMRAGRAAVVTPFFADQPFWGQRVAALGVGPDPIPAQFLTVGRLAEAIHAAVRDPRITQRAANLGVRLRAEDGVGNAVESVHRMLRGAHTPALQGV